MEIDNLVKELLDPNNLNPIIYSTVYGSLSDDGDEDVLAIYENQPLNVNVSVGKLDFVILGLKEFQSLLDSHDIVVTEPLLTGSLVSGDIKRWEKIKKSFLKRKPDSSSVFYLLSRSLEVFHYAKGFLDRFQQTNNTVEYQAYWNNISFSLGYLEFASLYKQGVFPLTLNDVMAKSSFFREIIAQKRAAKRLDSIESDLELMKKALRQFQEEYVNYFKIKE